MSPEEIDDDRLAPEEPGDEMEESAEVTAQPTQEAPAAAVVTPEELAQLRHKAAEYDSLLDRLKRVTADYENSLKRLDRASEERIKYAVESFAREMLPAIDNLSRAIESGRQKHSLEVLIEGVELVERQVYTTLARHGITPIETQAGAPFNAEVHDAVGVVHSEQHPANTIAEERQRGFRFHGRLLRPAQVLVSAGPQPPAAKEPSA